MSNTPELMAQLEPFVTVSATTPVTRALALLRKPSVNFVVVTGEGNPKALLVEDMLSSLVCEETDSLDDILSQLPASIVRVSDSSLDDYLLHAANDILETTNAPGLMISGKSNVRGIIPRGALSAMLSTVYRSSEVSFRMYVCRKSVPYEYSSPLEGDEPPLCPSYPIQHGPMDLV